MLSRLGRLFVVLVPVAVVGPGGLADPTECAAGIACSYEPAWVCCSPSASQCDNFVLQHCNLVATGDPFEQECGWN